MRHYLVDGYNLLYALPVMPPGLWAQKRQALLENLSRRKPHGRNRLTVIFDSREGGGDRMLVHDMEVIYTAGETADDWITRYVREVRQPRDLVVVTDDKGLWHMVRGTGAKVMTTKSFWETPAAPPARQDSSAGWNAITEELKKKWLE